MLTLRNNATMPTDCSFMPRAPTLGQDPWIGEHVAISVVADADPLVLCKITQMLSLSNTVPQSLVSSLAEGDTMHVTAVLVGAAPQTLDIVRRKLIQLTCVVSVDVARCDD
jgi:hypothetical protein